jgi:hypothetical protein
MDQLRLLMPPPVLLPPVGPLESPPHLFQDDTDDTMDFDPESTPPSSPVPHRTPPARFPPLSPPNCEVIDVTDFSDADVIVLSDSDVTPPSGDDSVTQEDTPESRSTDSNDLNDPFSLNI